jgi:hypothetical protein
MVKRFRVSKTACVTFGPPSTDIGQIVDVSMKGLACTYVPGRQGPVHSSELSILLPQHGFYLRDLPFRVASDREVKGVSPRGSPTRRCEVKFGDLTPSQLSQLEHFVKYHTTGESAGEKAG